MARIAWNYTSPSWFEAFASQTESEREPFPTATNRKQAQMLNELGEEGWEVYEIKFDSDGYPLYFLRLDVSEDV